MGVDVEGAVEGAILEVLLSSGEVLNRAPRLQLISHLLPE
jgi:hypothetical protein